MFKKLREKKREIWELQVRQTWDGISINHKKFDAVKESKAYTLLWKAITVYLVVAGGIGCILSAIDCDYNTFMVNTGLFLISLLAASLYLNSIWENVGYMLIFAIMTYMAFRYHNYVNSGFYAVLNDLQEKVTEYFEIEAMRSFGERVSDRELAITFLALYGGSAICILINVIISRRMRVALAIFLTGMGLFVPLYMECEPDLLYVIMFLTGTTFAGAIHNNGHYELSDSDSKYEVIYPGVSKGKVKNNSGIINYIYSKKSMFQALLVFSLLIAFISAMVAIVVPKDTFHENQTPGRLKLSTMETVQNVAMFGIAGLFNYYANAGGMSSGKLGGVGTIRLDYEPDLNIRYVPVNSDRIYLRNFIGKDYIPMENYWVSVGDKTHDSITNYTELAYKKQYESDDATHSVYMSGKGIMSVTNLGTTSVDYFPYYTPDEGVGDAHTKVFTYYLGNGLSEAYTPKEESKDIWLSVPEEDLVAVSTIEEKAGLSGSPEEIIQKLADYYQKNIPYSYQPGVTPRGKDFVDYFLLHNKKGFCTHFASAGVLILRDMGIPARYVEGYAVDAENVSDEGEIVEGAEVSEYYDGYNEFPNPQVVSVNVTDASAHAWIEVYIEGQGWKVVELTPSSDEEPGDNIWSRFMQLFNGDTDANAANNSTDNVDDTDTEISIPKIPGFVWYGFFLLAVMIIIFRYHRYMTGWFMAKNKYRKYNKNDRIVYDYQKTMKRLSKKHPEILEEKTYEDQLSYVIAEENRDDLKRMSDILKKAGYGYDDISDEDDLWLRGMLKKLL